MNDFIRTLNDQIYLSTVTGISFGRNKTPGRCFGCHTRYAQSSFDMGKMAQANFFESETLPRLYTAIGKVVLPILFVTCVIVFYITEIKKGIEVTQAIECLLIFVAILGIGYYKVATFQIVKHLCQAASTISCSLFNLSTHEALTLGCQQPDYINVPFRLTEQSIIEFIKFITQVTSTGKYQRVYILWKTEIRT